MTNGYDGSKHRSRSRPAGEDGHPATAGTASGIVRRGVPGVERRAPAAEDGMARAGPQARRSAGVRTPARAGDCQGNQAAGTDDGEPDAKEERDTTGSHGDYVRGADARCPPAPRGDA